MLDRFMFDSVNLPPCAVTVRCVRDRTYIHPRIEYDVVMNVVVEGYVLDFIRLGSTKN